MYCLLQFHQQLKDDIVAHRPVLKITCIKLVIFFCFWQAFVISLLTAKDGPLKPTKHIRGPDWRIGLPSFLVCIEMSGFAILHHFAFPWQPYDLGREDVPDKAAVEELDYVNGPMRALVSAWNPWDIIKAFSRGLRWLFVGRRYRKDDPSYQPAYHRKPGFVASVANFLQSRDFLGKEEEATGVKTEDWASAGEAYVALHFLGCQV
jgi:hypothetical protein